MGSLSCPACRAPLNHVSGEQGFAFCPSCGTPAFFGDLSSPFSVLGTAKSFSLDESAIEARYYELSKRLHPDRFVSAGTSTKMRSHELSAALNKAYFALRQPEHRLEALLKSAGALERTTSVQAQIPSELAEEYFEIQEAVMEGDTRAKELLDRFATALEKKCGELTTQMHQLASKIDWNSTDAIAAKTSIDRIVELRGQRSYVKSMIENLERLAT